MVGSSQGQSSAMRKTKARIRAGIERSLHVVMPMFVQW